MLGRIATLGADLLDLWERQADWSQRTFGPDTERGPIGPLKHLEKEAREAQANPIDRTEYADCLLLVLDASRRAGIKLGDLITEAIDKQKINMARTWPTPQPDMPVEHVKN